MRADKISSQRDELDYAPKSTPNPSTHEGEQKHGPVVKAT
jgi:hypothetical protein